MGVFSKHHRYREAGEQANVNNVERFGVPHHSLFTSTKVFTLHHHIDIVDENEQIVYQARTKVFSLHDTTDLLDASGAQVAQIRRKILSIHQRHFVTMADGLQFELSTELLHLVKDITNIVGLDWQLRGNVLGMNFALYDREENIVAVISQKMFSLHDKYCVDIYRPEDEAIVAAILVTLQHMIRDRQAVSSSSSASSGS